MGFSAGSTSSREGVPVARKLPVAPVSAVAVGAVLGVLWWEDVAVVGGSRSNEVLTSFLKTSCLHLDFPRLQIWSGSVASLAASLVVPRLLAASLRRFKGLRGCQTACSPWRRRMRSQPPHMLVIAESRTWLAWGF